MLAILTTPFLVNADSNLGCQALTDSPTITKAMRGALRELSASPPRMVRRQVLRYQRGTDWRWRLSGPAFASAVDLDALIARPSASQGNYPPATRSCARDPLRER